MNQMTASEMYQRDARFRAQASAAVARAVDTVREHIDPNNLTLRDLHEVATEAAINVLKMVLEGDAELHAMRVERDHYRRAAESALISRPVPLVVPLPASNDAP